MALSRFAVSAPFTGDNQAMEAGPGVEPGCPRVMSPGGSRTPCTNRDGCSGRPDSGRTSEQTVTVHPRSRACHLQGFRRDAPGSVAPTP